MSRQLAGTTSCIVNGEDVAAFNSKWQALLRTVHRRFFWLDSTQIEDAISDVIMRRLMRRTEKGEGALQREVDLPLRSLYGSVCRRVGDDIRAQQRRSRREREYAQHQKSCSEESLFVANRPLAANIDVEERFAELEGVLKRLDTTDQAFVRLRLNGYTVTAAYFQLVGKNGHPIQEQQREAKRKWDRIVKRIQRWRSRLNRSRIHVEKNSDSRESRSDDVECK